jgi:predicted flap endonuclease-1-like 5' DNA nuclease
MANYQIEDVEGIGSVRGGKFRACDVKDTDALLANGRTPKQRADLAEKTGLSEKLILKYVNMVDLYRVNGIGSEFSELLEASGVDTVPELAQRDAENLAKKLSEVNEAKQLTRRVPGATEVAKWIEQAKTLPRAIEY